MSQSFANTWIVVVLMAVIVGLSPTAFGQTSGGTTIVFDPLSEDEEELPSVLVDEQSECRHCDIRTIKDKDDAESTAVVEVYYEDEQPQFCGNILLEFVLVDDSYHYTVIEEIVIQLGEIGELLVDPGANWNWDDVTEVRVEPIRGC